MPNATTSVECFCLKCKRRRGRVGIEWLIPPDNPDGFAAHLWDLVPPDDPDHGDRIPTDLIREESGGRRLRPGVRGQWRAPFTIEIGPEGRVYVVEHKQCDHRRRWNHRTIERKLLENPSELRL